MLGMTRAQAQAIVAELSEKQNRTKQETELLAQAIQVLANTWR